MTESATSPMEEPRRYRFSLRARLSFLYGVAFFLAGAILVGVNYGLVRHSLESHRISLVVVRGSDVDPDAARIPTQALADEIAREELAARHAALSDLLRESIFALIIVGLLAYVLGYVVAGQALRPVHRITAAARRVAGGNLNERISLAGPDDEVKELADTFDHMVSRLDKAFSSQRRFVANASHELRTPLATNRAVLEVAMSAPDASDDMKDTGAKLLKVTERNEQLIDGLLTLARSENDLAERSVADLATIARHAVETLRDEYQRAGVGLTRQLDTAPTLGSTILLERLVANLLQNAARYNTRGGSVRLRTGINQGWSMVEVANTGRDIDPSTVEHLFEPFHRGSAQRTERRGAGLGLSIVRAVSRNHGGGATAWPNPGGGLIVRAWFPPVAPARPAG